MTSNKAFDPTFNKIVEMAMRDGIDAIDTLSFFTNPKPTFPPHNIVEVADNEFCIQLAVAGFSIKDISIEVKDKLLVVKGNKVQDGTTQKFLYQGIAQRPFTKEFLLSEHIEVIDAHCAEGILVINLKRVVPEHKKPRTIEIKPAGNILLG